MQSTAASVEEYLAGLPADRRETVSTVRDTINAHLPDGYVEQMEWGMISWVVPLEVKPDTYNGKPLSYVSLASQKKHLAVYLLGLDAESPELEQLQQGYADRGLKLDMGKSCVRFRTLDELPLDVLGQAVESISVGELVARHDRSRGSR